ncbi:MAG: flagellar type III secretion system protein FliR [Mesorhizobium sp.]|nr:flagellar type III secretion system protein FliR [Mesorhizobium sp.]
MIGAVTVDTAIMAIFLAFCRIGACFMLMPGLSSARVPMQVRLFIAVAVSLALFAHLWESIVPHVESGAGSLATLIVSEMLIGATIGLVARFYLLAVQFIGSVIAMVSGFNAMAAIAIEDNDPQSPLAGIISFSALMILFIFDFHHAVVRALVDTYEVMPLEALFNPQVALVNLVDTISDSFMVMVRLGSPFIAYAILVNLAIGLVNKLTPQIPIYFVALPFVIAGALLMMYFAISPMLSLMADGFIPSTIGR